MTQLTREAWPQGPRGVILDTAREYALLLTKKSQMRWQEALSMLLSASEGHLVLYLVI